MAVYKTIEHYFAVVFWTRRKHFFTVTVSQHKSLRILWIGYIPVNDESCLFFNDPCTKLTQHFSKRCKNVPNVLKMF